MGLISKIYQIPDEEFKERIANATSINNFLKTLGMGHGRSSNDLVIKRCKELNISTDHFNSDFTSFIEKKDLEESLVKDSTFISSSHLKSKLIKAGLLENECALCHNKGIWNGQPLTLQLDHINGDHHDNRIGNLRLLCPNCHTQTETYGSKCRTK